MIPPGHDGAGWRVVQHGQHLVVDLLPVLVEADGARLDAVAFEVDVGAHRIAGLGVEEYSLVAGSVGARGLAVAEVG